MIGPRLAFGRPAVFPVQGLVSGPQGIIDPIWKRGTGMRMDELTYSNMRQSWIKRMLICGLERLSGRDRLAPIYRRWSQEIFPHGGDVFSRLLDMLDIRLRIRGDWPPLRVPDGPLVVIANHPFGMADGLSLLALGEQLGRPCRMLMNHQLFGLSEIAASSLPVSFETTREALRINRDTATEAIRLLKAGTTILIFPSGGVAEARRLFGPAEDMPWKSYTAKLIAAAEANVLPVYFEGRNSRLFLAAGVLSDTLRAALHLRQFFRLSGRSVTARVGTVIPWQYLSAFETREAMLAHLKAVVLDLAQGQANLPSPHAQLPVPA